MEYLEILQLIAKEDQKGLEALYLSYGNKFYGYAIMKWKLNEDEAWDVVYKTLDTLILKLSEYSFESKHHFENFLFKVFINYLRQYYRNNRKNQHNVVYMDMSSASFDDSENTQEHLAIDKQVIKEYNQSEYLENPKLLAFVEALQKLEELDRDILLLKAQNYSYKEISLMLNLEDEQLKVRHHRAKQKLLKQLQTHSNETL